MSRLILVEGIPGSGKTTTSKFIQQILIDNGIEAKSYQEGDLHPTDLSWQSLLSRSKFKSLFELNPDYSNVLMESSSIEGELVVTAYNRLGLNHDTELYKSLSENDIYTKDVGLNIFKEEHLKRWKRFSLESNNNKTYIFECALLQNHITELMLKYEASNEKIKSYLYDFFDAIKPMSPIIIYLAPLSVEKSINHVADERTINEDPRRSHNWIDRVVKEISESNYGNHHNINDVNGCIKFYEDRQKIELELLNHLNIKCFIIKHDGDEWEEVRSRIRKIIT